MQKKTKKPKQATDTTPEAVVVLPEPAWKQYFPYAVTAVFFFLSLAGILNHEMWRDEYQAWMVAADAHSIPQLFQNLKYEGHPVLWHGLLFILSMISDDPFWMQILHILISVSFIFLINRHAPFSIIERVLLTFGYYTFFEYNLISRSYGLAFLLIIIFCILYRNRQKNLLWMALVLFMLSEISIFGIILATCLFLMIVFEQVAISKKSKVSRIPLSRMALFGGITLFGLLTGYLQIMPEPDNSFPTFYVTEFDISRLKWAFSRLIHAYFPIPDFTGLHFWNTNIFVPNEVKFAAGITPVLFLLWIISFLRYRAVLVVYSIGTLVLLGFYYYTGFIWARYAGHLFVLLIACYWLMYYSKEKGFRNRLVNSISVLGQKISRPYFILILSVAFIGGVIAFTMDMKHPFSTSEQAAQFIKDHHLDSLEIIGSKDYVISPLATQLNKEIFYAERKEPGSFIIYDQQRTNIWHFDEVQATISEKWERERKPILLVKDLPIFMTFHDTGESILWEDGLLTDSLAMTLLTIIPPGIVKDETYHIYLIDKFENE